MEEKPTQKELRDALLIEVGNCIHEWSCVELEIANLFMILHGIKRDYYAHPVRAAYEAVISLDARLAMMVSYVTADDEICENYLQHIRSLTARTLKLYKKRHAVAHFIVVARERKEKIEYMIRPFFTWDTFSKQKGAELNATTLKERAQLFRMHAAMIQRHVQHVGALRALPLEYYAQDGERAFPPLDEASLTQEES